MPSFLRRIKTRGRPGITFSSDESVASSYSLPHWSSHEDSLRVVDIPFANSVDQRKEIFRKRRIKNGLERRLENLPSHDQGAARLFSIRDFKDAETNRNNVLVEYLLLEYPELENRRWVIQSFFHHPYNGIDISRLCFQWDVQAQRDPCPEENCGISIKIGREPHWRDSSLLCLICDDDQVISMSGQRLCCRTWLTNSPSSCNQ